MKAADLLALLASVPPWSPIEITGVRFTGEDLRNTRFKAARLIDVTFDSCDLTSCWFLKCHLEKAAFVGSKMDRSDFSDTQLEGLQLVGCSMVEGSLSHTTGTRIRLESSNFDRATIVKAFWKELHAPHISFAGANLLRATITQADLRDATLLDANLTAISLTDVDLRGAKIQGTDWTRARLERVRIAGVTGRAAETQRLSATDVEIGENAETRGRLATTDDVVRALTLSDSAS